VKTGAAEKELLLEARHTGLACSVVLWVCGAAAGEFAGRKAA